MANQDLLTVKAALNTDTSGKWDEQTAVSVTTSTVASTAINTKTYQTIGVHTDGELYISWNSAADTLDDAKALKLAQGLTFIKVPLGVVAGGTVYFAYKAVTATVNLRIVLM